MKILVIGETCRDKFVYGDAIRLCPEAPVPVFRKKSVINIVGMAGNVKNNLTACAKDLEQQIEVDIFTNIPRGYKTRYIDSTSNQMFLRVDSDSYQTINLKELSEIEFNNYDAVVVSDYNKGFLNDDDLYYISMRAKLSFLDTKKRYNAKWAKHFNFIKLNEKEYEENGFKENEPSCLSNLIVTLGSRGCKFANTTYPLERVSQVRDVSGAGDTFLAAFSLYYTATKDIKLAIAYAQRCCNIVVSKAGTATI
jgi:D-beta-D-heptose 7-phosphate kinase/D-beta-D-heptose 1-phosphate adenosyltransferase